MNSGLLRILAKYGDMLEVQAAIGVLEQEIWAFLSLSSRLCSARKIKGSLHVFLPLENKE